MRHLILPFFCAFVVGLLLALLVCALRTGADSFTLGASIGIGFFAWRGFEDTKRVWPLMRADRERAAERRRREAQQNPHPVTDDLH
ncbi:hypothetical protein [Stenotrophomonas sp. PSU-St15]